MNWNPFKRTPPNYKDEPCFIADSMGEITEGKLRTYVGGQKAVLYLTFWWLQARDDGTVDSSAHTARKWWL